MGELYGMIAVASGIIAGAIFLSVTFASQDIVTAIRENTAELRKNRKSSEK